MFAVRGGIGQRRRCVSGKLLARKTHTATARSSFVVLVCFTAPSLLLPCGMARVKIFLSLALATFMLPAAEASMPGAPVTLWSLAVHLYLLTSPLARITASMPSNFNLMPILLNDKSTNCRAIELRLDWPRPPPRWPSAVSWWSRPFRHDSVRPCQCQTGATRLACTDLRCLCTG